MSIKTLGLEFSTQSAKAVVLDSDAGVVYKGAINYDDTFEDRYPISGGVLKQTNGELHSSPMMLIEAHDAIFQRMAINNDPLPEISALRWMACSIALSIQAFNF